MIRNLSPEPPKGEVTKLLQEWREGNQVAFAKVIPLVYEDLRKVAGHYLKAGSPHHTLQPTALVHEVYLRLMGNKPMELKDRTHFFRCACLIMRQILMRYARGQPPRALGDVPDGPPLDQVFNENGELGIKPETILALDGALHRLKSVDARKHRVVEIRFFVGMTIEETAQALNLSPETVGRDWRAAKGWLAKAMGAGKKGSPGNTQQIQKGG